MINEVNKFINENFSIKNNTDKLKNIITRKEVEVKKDETAPVQTEEKKEETK